MSTLWRATSTERWHDALASYEDVVSRQRVARLAELDQWYRDELPGAIAARDKPYVTHAELVRLTEWKMARGVWRAPNLVLVRGNDARQVVETSTAAFAAVPHPDEAHRHARDARGRRAGDRIGGGERLRARDVSLLRRARRGAGPVARRGEVDDAVLRAVRRGAARASRGAGRGVDADDGRASAVGVGGRKGRHVGALTRQGFAGTDVVAGAATTRADLM